MIRALGPKGIPVPPGFATSSYAYWHYVDANNIRGKIDELVSQWQAGHQTLAEAGHAIRNLFLRGTWPADTAEAILSGYRDLCDKAQVDNLSVAVRSSATAEDLPDASFAGQQETYLNVQGDDALLDACRRCYASLFTDRAISYRQIKEFSHASVALSIGVQQMVRSDIGGSGVMFSIDTESGFDKIVLINAAWGLGENVVQGTVNPDEYQVFKPLLANMNLTLILSKKLGDKSIKMVGERGHTLTTGLSIGDKAVSGRTCLLTSVSDMDKFIDGSILVTEATDPDWVPVMKRAAAIITDQGGRTSHAAIVSRELGVPAVVGTGNATYVLHTGQDVTVSCAEGDSGLVYDGISEITTQMVHISELPSVRTKIMLNLANPAAAYRWWRIPVDGIGLARMEFVVSNAIQVHPMALIHFEHLKDEQAKREIDKLTTGYAYKPDYFVDKLASGLATLCSAVYPKPAIIRMSDFKTNEYARLIGGAEFELKEENPMIGFRGASRYYSPRYKEGFALECRAVKRVREEMGLTNAIVMIPFCRTIKEARKVLDVMEENGLKRGENGLKVYVMCEIPSNVILASSFTKHFDGFSIGSNDLAQLTLGVDRDSRELASLFNEQDEAVKWMIARAIEVARREGCKIGLCGEAPSNHPEFAKFLVDAGIDSISVSPDSFVQVMKHVVASERGS
uniref:pyruvate, water dikinase n=1 Tax=Fusarium oxysporum (strain Fo5176) TaxID=660025 RepID=A0A0C4DI24_FUSOF